MAAVSISVRGRATAEVAWQRYADPALWSTWAPQIQRVETTMTRLTAGAAGSTGTVHAGVTSRPTLRVHFEVLEVDPAARCWTWRARVGPVSLRLEHSVEDDARGCATSLRVHGPWPVVLAYAPVARLALTRLVAAGE